MVRKLFGKAYDQIGIILKRRDEIMETRYANHPEEIKTIQYR